MTYKTLSRFYDLTHALHRTIPLSPEQHTYGPCPTTGCTNSGRGSGRCEQCLTQALGEIVGQGHAEAYTALLRSNQKLYGKLKALAEQ